MFVGCSGCALGLCVNGIVDAAGATAAAAPAAIAGPAAAAAVAVLWLISRLPPLVL